MSLRQLRARQVTAMLLVVLLAAPAWSNPAVVGVASGSEVARVRGAVLTPGTTIFSGDIVEVGARGRTRLTLSSGGHVVVGENSSLQLAQDENRVVFELLRGQAAFRLASPMVEARLVDVTIRTADPESTGVLLWNRRPRP
jgi:FecR protein.